MRTFHTVVSFRSARAGGLIKNTYEGWRESCGSKYWATKLAKENLLLLHFLNDQSTENSIFEKATDANLGRGPIANEPFRTVAGPNSGVLATCSKIASQNFSNSMG